jgi:hypothetical protein
LSSVIRSIFWFIHSSFTLYLFINSFIKISDVASTAVEAAQWASANKKSQSLQEFTEVGVNLFKKFFCENLSKLLQKIKISAKVRSVPSHFQPTNIFATIVSITSHWTITHIFVKLRHKTLRVFYFNGKLFVMLKFLSLVSSFAG